MTIHEKLEFLTENHNKAAVSRLCGLWAQWLYQTLKHKYSIRTPIAVRLAAVLKVDPAWLIDDSRGLPPVHLYRLTQPTEASTEGAA